jgi:hypothetical protein
VLEGGAHMPGRNVGRKQRRLRQAARAHKENEREL